MHIAAIYCLNPSMAAGFMSILTYLDAKNEVTIDPLLLRTYQSGNVIINCYSAKLMGWGMDDSELPHNAFVKKISMGNVSNYALNIVNINQENNGYYECTSPYEIDQSITGDFMKLIVYPTLQSIFSGKIVHIKKVLGTIMLYTW